MLFNRTAIFIKASFVLCLIMLLASCRKDKAEVNIEGVTGYKWTVLTSVVRFPGLTTYYYRPVTGEFYLNNDQSFTAKLGYGKGSGTYTWTTKDSVNGVFNVTFTVKESDAAFDEWKPLLASVNVCSDSKLPSDLGSLGNFSFAKMLHFDGSEGGLYIYR